MSEIDVFSSLRNKINRHAEANKKEETDVYVWQRAISPLLSQQQGGNEGNKFEQLMKDNNKKEGIDGTG